MMFPGVAQSILVGGILGMGLALLTFKARNKRAKVHKENRSNIEYPLNESQENIKIGDDVVYQQRDGTWVPANVVSVDMGVQPPSYGIELLSSSGGYIYRETELHRLRADV